MDGPSWKHVKRIFQEALDREPHRRKAFVREACGDDEALRAEVESLLAAHERAGSFAERPAIESASGSALRPGDAFGAYQIVEWLGAGGMGEVYRARDPMLNRDVALKVLPGLFAHDPDRLLRFKREAQVLAALNHPNIAAIYGFEESGDRKALVLELVGGPTLADRLAREPVPLNEALHVAGQIADALEAAHEKGIVHRDLKPSNVKLRPDGVVKMLDFGLAKAFAPDPTRPHASNLPESQTMALDGTREGVILGTAAYMSPEQARGKAVDRRTDIWAFGCVLFEMLAGRPAFAGADATETIAAIVRDEPAWNVLPSETPPRVRSLLRRCLDKDPQQRMRDIGDARLVMDGAFDTPSSTRGDTPAPATGSRWKRFGTYAAVLLLGGVMAGLVMWSRIRSEPPLVTRVGIQLGAGETFSFTGRHLVAMSPDDRLIVYAANGRLNLRHLDQLHATGIAGTEGGGRSPFFSPDGRQIGFWSANQLKKVAVSGGAPVTLCSVPILWGASWEDDNTILFGEGPDGIWRVAGTGGTPEAIIRVAAGESAHGPHLLPGGEWVLFTLLPKGTESWNDAQIVAQSLRTGERRVLIRGGHDGQYVRTGHLLYALNERLLAVAFDPETLRVTGDASTVLDGVADAEGTTGASHFSVTPAGGLVYVSKLARRLPHTLVWVDREGREEAIHAPVREYVYPRISPDGSRVAVAIDVRNQENDVWIWDLARETLTRLSFGPGLDEPPVWTPDSRRVAFASDLDGGGLFWQAADGSGSVERITEGRALYPSAFSPDGAQLLFSTSNMSRVPSDIGMVAPGRGARPTPLIHTQFGELNAEVSPDGGWIAYQSDESGRPEVYVRPFPNVGEGRWQVSTNGGDRPLWARSGRELFYVASDGLMMVSFEPTHDPRIGKPRRLLDDRYFSGSAYLQGRTYDVSPDGRRFLLIKDAQESEAASSPSQLVLVLNWFEELAHLR